MRKLFRLAVAVLCGALAPSGVSSEGNAATGKASDFAFFIGSGEGAARKLFLVGKFRAGTKATLLYPDTGKTCAAEASANVECVDSSGAYLTEIVGPCQPAIDYGLAVMGTAPAHFGTAVRQPLTELGKISQLDGAARRSKALMALRTKAQDNVPAELADLEGITPKVYSLRIPKADAFVVEYDRKVPHLPIGPRVIAIRGMLHPLTGWCSFPKWTAFRLNGSYYILSGSVCCGCGISGMELFRITPEGPVVVISNYSLST